MKRIIGLIVCFVIMMSFTACSGNYAQVDLKEPITISEHGIIEKDVLDKIKKDNAIATFIGASGDIQANFSVSATVNIDFSSNNYYKTLGCVQLYVNVNYK